MSDNNILGNGTTIINYICLLILPYVSMYGVSQSQLIAIVSAIVGVVFAYLNSKYPHSFDFLSQDNEEDTDDEEVVQGGGTD